MCIFYLRRFIKDTATEYQSNDIQVIHLEL